MNDPDSVAQFHAAGASPGIRAVYNFNARALDSLLPANGRLLDLGTGSGRALSAILHRRPDLTATGVELSANMLAAADALFAEEGISDRVQLVEADITALPVELTTKRWDAISCMWTLHQLPDLNVLRVALRQIAALRHHSGSAIWIFDLQRMRDPRAYPTLIGVVAPAMHPVFRKDGIASEAAAFTAAELTAELSAAGFNGKMRSGLSRPLPYLQAHWLPHASGQRCCHPQPHRRDTVSEVAQRVYHNAVRLRWAFSATPF